MPSTNERRCDLGPYAEAELAGDREGPRLLALLEGLLFVAQLDAQVELV
jgi:hypothetical protein